MQALSTLAEIDHGKLTSQLQPSSFTPSLTPLSVKNEATILMCGELNVYAAISDENAVDRQALESFVRTMFHKVHTAKITHFMPKLMSLRDSHGQLRAVCGLRHADEDVLFLEQYFTKPIEQILSDKTGRKIQRQHIVEIGNLAILEPACIRSLLASISVYLHHSDAHWAVFTGITTLHNALMRLKMPLQILGEATLSSLPSHEQAAWGKYYQSQPQVMAISRMQSNDSSINI